MRELKSILKPPRSSHSAQAKTRAEAEQIALAHARIIQQQKDLELQILEAIETLSTYPLTVLPAVSASRPAPSDASSFKSLIRPFQPSDYDDLVEERNVLGRCGYALCPRPRRTDLGGARYALVNHNRADFAVVETRDLQRWCGEACARRALYVKVQLSETAAWERAAMPDVRIDLLDEQEDESEAGKEVGGAAGLEEDVARLRLGEQRKAKSDSAALSLERGDVLERGDEGKSRRVVPLAPKMELSIREKDVTKPARPPKQDEDADGDGHLVLEGYKARFGAQEEDS